MKRIPSEFFLLAALAGCGSAPASNGGGGASSTSSSAEGSASSSASASSTSASSSASASSTSASSGGDDPLTGSFVYTGCNRIDKADWDAVANPSSANVAQLTQTFADVTALPEQPKYFFFTGDLVLGLDPDPAPLTAQLEGWAKLYAADPSGIAAGVPLVPLVGNHEMLAKIKVSGSKVELSNAGADAVWTSWITAHGFGAHAGNGPTAAAPNADALQDDQSQLTYSFVDAGVHYVVLNTDTWTTTPDPATSSTQIGWIAMKWLANDLAAADASPAVHHIVVLGHKPIVPPLGNPASDSAINPVFTSALEALLDQTTKVRGYLCAHAHLWDARKLPGKRGVYQVVAGNGGSTVEAAWATPFYGFTEVRFYASGKVGVVSHQRPVPDPYTQAPAAPAQAQPEQIIAP